MTVEKREAMQEIAKPILSVEEGKNVEITEENRIVYYEFSIKNFKEESVSDISFWYTIEIISSLKDIEVELYEDEENVQITDLKTNPIFIQNYEKVEQDYRLKITYTGESRATSGRIKIKIEAEQEKKQC